MFARNNAVPRITGEHSNRNPRWTKKTRIPLGRHTIFGSDYCTITVNVFPSNSERYFSHLLLIIFFFIRDEIEFFLFFVPLLLEGGRWGSDGESILEGADRCCAKLLGDVYLVVFCIFALEGLLGARTVFFLFLCTCR